MDLLKRIIIYLGMLALPLGLLSACGDSQLSKSFSSDISVDGFATPPPDEPAVLPTLEAAQSSSSGEPVTWMGGVQDCINHLEKDAYGFGHSDLDCQTHIAYLDCSGFVTDVAQFYYPAAYKTLSAKGPHPSASDYYNIFSNPKNNTAEFKSVASIEELQPGDLIMWVYDAATSRQEGGATGHIMLVVSAAEKMPTPNYYKVVVADSADSGHDQDTRVKGESGLGIGTIYFETNGVKAPIAYGWNDDKSWVSTFPIAMGRMLNPENYAKTP